MNLNLKNDIIFKAFFSKKGNEEFLIDFLNALLKIEIHKIRIDEEVDLGRLYENEKTGRLDLQAELNEGVIVDIDEKLNQWLALIDDMDKELIKMIIKCTGLTKDEIEKLMRG